MANKMATIYYKMVNKKVAFPPLDLERYRRNEKMQKLPSWKES